MSAGIKRVHGYAAAPSQRPSTISFFTITFAANILSTATTGSDVNVVDGALDRIFRSAVTRFATVAMIGTVATNGLSLKFAIEDTGTDVLSVSGLGLGSSSDAVNYGTTAASLQAAIASLGTVNGIDLAAATVATFPL